MGNKMFCMEKNKLKTFKLSPKSLPKNRTGPVVVCQENSRMCGLYLELCHFLASLDPESETEERRFRAPTKKGHREPETERELLRMREGA